MSPLGVYVHFPWCRKLCPYCDFAVEVAAPDEGPPHERYLAAIVGELELRSAAFVGAGDLVSIYFGGGTPSLWKPACIAEAIARIRDAFAAHGEARQLEITLEANPSDCTDELLHAWRAAGVGRVSIGVQSQDPEELVTLGRDHRFGDGGAAVERALAAGFATSADFILGVPPQRRAPALDTRPPHLSVYELTIEERTAFGRRVRDGRLVPLDEDALADAYLATHAALVAAGYEHYEISSYARPGARAVHNSLYWRGVPFLGLGVGAASLEIAGDGSAIRRTNPRRAADYFAGVAPEVVTSTRAEHQAECAWLAMRTRDGLAERDLHAPGVVAWLLDEGLADRVGDRICPTLRGFLFADRIAARIVASWQPDGEW